MLQTFNGALAVIDEKLIRMKELAEQAATDTYDSTQRRMIDSEFQAMGAEINRIARATDFNGIKLINGEFEALATEVIGADGKTYDVKLNGSFVNAWPGGTADMATGWDTSGITDPSKLVGLTSISITNNNLPKIGNNLLLVTPQGGNTDVTPGTTLNINYDGAGNWTVNGTAALFRNANGFFWNDGTTAITTQIANADGSAGSMTGAGNTSWTKPINPPSFTSDIGNVSNAELINGTELSITVDLGNNNTITQTWNNVSVDTAVTSVSMNLNVIDTTPKPNQPDGPVEIPDNVVKIHFGTMNDSAEDYYYINKTDATLKGLGLEGVAIQTQDSAQGALVTVNDAIVKKDNIRAYYGAMQNRLENTVSNLSIQAENMQAAESRISDADIAEEMMTFVRNQVLTQSAVAILAQANSMPQMVMRLIG